MKVKLAKKRTRKFYLHNRIITGLQDFRHNGKDLHDGGDDVELSPVLGQELNKERCELLWVT